jgi:hypothetical protein
MFSTWFFSDEQLNKHWHTSIPFSIIHVLPFKQINVLQAIKNLFYIGSSGILNKYLHVIGFVHVDNIFRHVILLNLYLIDKNIYAFHIHLNNYEDYSHIMVGNQMNNPYKDHIFHYLKYNLNLDNVLNLFYLFEIISYTENSHTTFSHMNKR